MGAKTPEERKRAKYAAMMRDRGTPLHITDAEHERLVAHIMKLYRRGMSCQAILDSVPGGTEIHDSAISKITRGQVGKCHRDTYNTLMRAQWVQPTALKTGRRIDGTGHRRRIRALVADGWPMSLLGELVGVSTQAMFQQAVSERPVHASTVANFLPWYEKLAGADPRDYGATKLGVSRAKGNAARRNWEPSKCWDDDTIDDPFAIAEWTGECGTVKGWRIHYRDKVSAGLPCAACATARTIARNWPALGALMGVMPPPSRAGSNDSRADWPGIRQALAEGMTTRHIAADFGVSTRTVDRIKKGE